MRVPDFTVPATGEMVTGDWYTGLAAVGTLPSKVNRMTEPGTVAVSVSENTAYHR